MNALESIETAAAPLDGGEQRARRADARARASGVIQAIYRVLKLAQLHALDNQAVRKQLEIATEAIRDYHVRSGENVNIFFVRGAVFFGGAPLRAQRAGYDAALELASMVERCNASELTIEGAPNAGEMRQFIVAFLAAMRDSNARWDDDDFPRFKLRKVPEEILMRGVTFEQLDPDKQIVRIYASAIVILRHFFEKLGAGSPLMPPQIKRIALNLIYLSEGKHPAFLGVINARNANHDEAGRAINTAILAVAMARQITEDRLILTRLAMAAMLHDVGRARALKFQSLATDDGCNIMAHLTDESERSLPGGAAAVLTALGGVNEPSMVRTVIAYESLWLRRAHRLGPVYRAARAPSLQARIVATARAYNEILTPIPGEPPLAPVDALILLDAEVRAATSVSGGTTTESVDRTVFRLLIGALGVVAPGTLLELATGEIAIVLEGPPAEPGVAPRLRIVTDRSGGMPQQAVELTLGGDAERRVVKVVGTDPGYGRRASPPAAAQYPPSAPAVSAPAVIDVQLEPPAPASKSASRAREIDLEDSVPMVPGRRPSPPAVRRQVDGSPATSQRGDEMASDVRASNERAMASPPGGPAAPGAPAESARARASASAPAASRHSPDTAGPPRRAGGANISRPSGEPAATSRRTGGPPSSRVASRGGEFADSTVATPPAIASELLARDSRRDEGGGDRRPTTSTRDDGVVSVPRASRPPIAPTPAAAVAAGSALGSLGQGQEHQGQQAQGRTPDVHGTLAQSPLPHLLVHVLARSATGSLILKSPGERDNIVYFVRGAPGKVRAYPPVARLGETSARLGFLHPDDVERAAARARANGLLIGRQLVADGKLEPNQLVTALRSQVVTRLTMLLAAGSTGSYEFFGGIDLLDSGAGEEATPCDPLATLMVVNRRWSELDRMDQSLARLGERRIVLHPASTIERFALSDEESAILDRVRSTPLSYPALVRARVADPSVVRVLVYTLAITRHIDIGVADAWPLGVVRGRPSSRAVGDDDAASARASSLPMSSGAFSPSLVPPSPTGAPAVLSSSPEPASAPRASTRARDPRLEPSGAPETSRTGTGAMSPFRARTPEEPGVSAFRSRLLERASGLDSQDHFMALGVSPRASQAEVDGAYLAASEMLNPNTLPEDLADLRETAARILLRLTEARNVLTDPQRRELYVRSLGETGDEARALDAWTSYQRAEVHLKRGELDAAERFAARAVECDPEIGEYLALLGWIRGNLQTTPGGAQEALELLDRAIGVDPLSDRALYYRGSLLKRIGRDAQAFRDFRTAADINPRNSEVLREIRLQSLRADNEGDNPGSSSNSRPGVARSPASRRDDDKGRRNS